MLSREITLIDGFPDSTTIKLFGAEMVVERGRLGVHLLLGSLLDQCQEAVEAREVAEINRVLHAYLALAVGKEDLEGLEFLEFGTAINELRELNRLHFFPPFMEEEHTEVEPPPWSYKERGTAIWVHRLAMAYQWSREEILELVPEEAVIYLQEIMLDDQLRKEWEWDLCSFSRVYNPKTKTSRHQPLPRPGWMVQREPQIVKIPISALPVGVVIDLGGGGAPGATEVIEPPKK